MLRYELVPKKLSGIKDLWVQCMYWIIREVLIPAKNTVFQIRVSRKVRSKTQEGGNPSNCELNLR